MTTTLEAFVGRLGHLGPSYQVLVFLLLACNFYPIAFNRNVMTFYGYEPPHHCKMPEGWAWHRNNSIPIVVNNGHTDFHSCKMYKDPENHALGNKNCVHGWQYQLEPPEWPIVAEWNLVCDRSHLVNVVNLVYYGGGLLGALVFSTISDKFGRRPILLTCLYAQTVFGMTTFFVKRYAFFVALRLAQGFFIQGLEVSTFTMVMELFHPRIRALAGSTCFAIYATGMMFLALLGYSIQHWQYIQLAISLPSVITICYLCLIPESLRWLMISKKLDDVTSVIKKCLRFDPESAYKNVGEDVEDICKQLEIGPELTLDLRDLFRSPNLLKNTLFHCFCWFSAFLMYSSIALFMQTMSDNKYLNFFLIALIELFAYLFAYLALNRFGRRKPLFLLFILSGVLSIASVLVEHLAKSQSDSVHKVSLTLAILAKISITGCISGLYIFSAETFPTVIRSIGIGLCSFWKILACILVPFIHLLGAHTLKAIPVILIGAVAMVAAFVALMLPETFTKSLPDTVSDAENLSNKAKPMVDKPSSGTPGSKIVPVTDPPATPPRKRSSSLSLDANEKDFATSKEDGECHKTGDCKEGSDAGGEDGNSKEGSRRSSKLVRFLGIDEVDQKIDQQTGLPRRKKSSEASNGERRVRFSNVVHDIEALMTAIQAIGVTIPNNRSTGVQSTDDDSQEDGVQTTEKGDETLLSEGAAANTAFDGSSDATDVTPDIKSIAQEILTNARPVMGILKKSSKEEPTHKKMIVRSPHPNRKNSLLKSSDSGAVAKTSLCGDLGKLKDGNAGPVEADVIMESSQDDDDSMEDDDTLPVSRTPSPPVDAAIDGAMKSLRTDADLTDRSDDDEREKENNVLGDDTIIFSESECGRGEGGCTSALMNGRSDNPPMDHMNGSALNHINNNNNGKPSYEPNKDTKTNTDINANKLNTALTTQAQCVVSKVCNGSDIKHVLIKPLSDFVRPNVISSSNGYERTRKNSVYDIDRGLDTQAKLGQQRTPTKTSDICTLSV